MFKKLGNNLAYILIGLLLAIAGGVVYAANVSVPQSPSKGAYLSGLASGNYQVTAACSNGQILAASSTATSGWACVTNTAALGATTTITSNVLINGPNFTFATSTTGSGTLGITGSGSTITFNLNTSALQPAGSYVTNSYASSTFPSFTYGTSTYDTYAYASSTRPTFAYGSSTYQTIISPPANTILIGNAGGTAITGSSLTQVTGTTLINGVTPIIDGGGDWLNNVIQSSGANVIAQTPTSTAVFGNLIQAGGVQYYQANTYLTPSQFCSGGLFNIASTSAVNIYFPTLSQQAASPCPGSPGAYASQFAQQFGVNSGSSSYTINASGSGETLLFAAGSGPTIYSGQTQNAIGQFVATSTLLGATSTGMTFQGYLNTYQPTSTEPSVTGQILSADSTGHGWQLTNLIAGSNITIATNTPNQITLATVSAPTFTGTSTLATTTVTGFTATGVPTLSGVSNCNSTQYLQITSGLFGCGTPAGGGGGASAFGTSSPNSIYTNYPNTASSTLGVNSSTPIAMLSVVGISGSSTPIVAVASSSQASYFTVLANGTVGINTSTPTYSVDISEKSGTTGLRLSGGNNPQARIEGTTAFAKLQACDSCSGGLNDSGSGIGLFGTENAYPFAIYTSNAERIRIMSTGYVGINTTTPSATLSVDGIGGIQNIFALASSSKTSYLTVSSIGNLSYATATANSLAGFDGSNNLQSELLGTGLSITGKTLNASNAFTGSGTVGQDAYWTSATALTSAADLLNNGTVVGVNATSTSVNFNIQGTGANTAFNVASSSGSSELAVASSGYVGIGTTTPLGTLVIQGTPNQANDLLDVYASSTLVMSVASSTLTNIIIGSSTETSNLAMLDIVGNSATSTEPLLRVASSSGTSILTVFANGHFGNSGALPTIATSTGDGASAGTATLDAGATDQAGLVTAVTGNAPATTATIWTLTFKQPYTKAPFCTYSSGTTTPAFIADTFVTSTPTTLILKSTTTALIGTSTYASYYHCDPQSGG